MKVFFQKIVVNNGISKYYLDWKEVTQEKFYTCHENIFFKLLRKLKKFIQRKDVIR